MNYFILSIEINAYLKQRKDSQWNDMIDITFWITSGFSIHLMELTWKLKRQ